MPATDFGATETATVNGTTLAYREEGSGEAVVFVHGGISDLRTWSPQVSGIGSVYRAVTYSRRAYRPNPPLERGGSDPIHRAPDDLAAFLRAVDAAPAHLVGNSAGGLFALLVAIREPRLVRSLVLCEPAVAGLYLSDPPRVGELLRLLATRPRPGLALLGYGLRTLVAMTGSLRRGDDERAARVFVRGVLGARAFDGLSPERWEQVMANLDDLRAYAHGAARFPPIDDAGVRSIRAPALLMTGEYGPTALHHLTDRLQELLPHAERVEIAGASHLMHEDDPAAVNEAILDFLARHAAIEEVYQ